MIARNKDIIDNVYSTLPLKILQWYNQIQKLSFTNFFQNSKISFCNFQLLQRCMLCCCVCSTRVSDRSILKICTLFHNTWWVPRCSRSTLVSTSSNLKISTVFRNHGGYPGTVEVLQYRLVSTILKICTAFQNCSGHPGAVEVL